MWPLGDIVWVVVSMMLSFASCVGVMRTALVLWCRVQGFGAFCNIGDMGIVCVGIIVSVMVF